MSTLLGFGGLAVLFVLGIACVERPRLAGTLSVTALSASAAYLGHQGAVGASIYCALYAVLYGLLAGMSYTTLKARSTKATKE